MKKHLQNFALSCLGLACLSFIHSCDSLRPDDQFTNKVVAPQFVSELFGSTTRTITVSHPNGAHVSWMGFIQSNDYKYYKILSVKAGDRTIVSDGRQIRGRSYTATSNAIIENFDVPASSGEGVGFANGNITSGSGSDLQVTIEYSPLIAIESNDKPHIANLIINYDSPTPGSMKVAIEGYTQGVKADKCTQAVSTMDAIEYTMVNGQFNFYLCGSEVSRTNQNNTPTDPSDPNYRGSSTNMTPISIPTPTLTFFQVDEETVCILSDPPSIEPLDIPIPEGLDVPIPSLPVELLEGSFAECSLDPEGNIFCDSNIILDSLVSLSGFSLSNQGFTEEETKTSDCPDFGAISGSGSFGDNELTVILKGTALSDTNTEEYNIVDALILAEIILEK